MADPHPAPTRRLERLNSVLNRVGMSRSFVYNAIAARDGAFPAPIKIGSASRWDSAAIDRWIEERLERAGQAESAQSDRRQVPAPPARAAAKGRSPSVFTSPRAGPRPPSPPRSSTP